MSDHVAPFTERDVQPGSGVEGVAAPSRRAVLRGFSGAGLAGAVGLAARGSARAQEATPEAGEGGALSTQDISLEQAQAIIAAALEKAAEIGTKMDVAVVDAGANLKAFARMDGAWLGSIDIAVDGAPFSLGCWHTDTYELRDGHWQVVWSQATAIEQPSESSRASGGQDVGA